MSCHPAQRMPQLARRGAGGEGGEGGEEGSYDRIVCDVPCSGDGTTRKNPSIWHRWSIEFALEMHPLQLQIALRGAALLRVGGLLCYSTCSLSPGEDESVVAELLRRCGGALELMDVSDRLPELPRAEGLHDWKVMVEHEPLDGSGTPHGGGLWSYGSYEELQAAALPSELKRRYTRSMWPPIPGASVSPPPLERCMRLLPHLADMGGFFVALLRKVAPLPGPPPREPRVKVRRTSQQPPAAPAAAAAAAPAAAAAAAATAADAAIGGFGSADSALSKSERKKLAKQAQKEREKAEKAAAKAAAAEAADEFAALLAAQRERDAQRAPATAAGAGALEAAPPTMVVAAPPGPLRAIRAPAAFRAPSAVIHGGDGGGGGKGGDGAGAYTRLPASCLRALRKQLGLRRAVERRLGPTLLCRSTSAKVIVQLAPNLVRLCCGAAAMAAPALANGSGGSDQDDDDDADSDGDSDGDDGDGGDRDGGPPPRLRLISAGCTLANPGPDPDPDPNHNHDHNPNPNPKPSPSPSPDPNLNGRLYARAPVAVRRLPAHARGRARLRAVRQEGAPARAAFGGRAPAAAQRQQAAAALESLRRRRRRRTHAAAGPELPDHPGTALGSRRGGTSCGAPSAPSEGQGRAATAATPHGRAGAPRGGDRGGGHRHATARAGRGVGEEDMMAARWPRGRA